MRVIPNNEIADKEEKKIQEVEGIRDNKTSPNNNFNEVLVKEIGLEFYGVSFFTSLGILKKSKGLCDMAKFFWKIAEDTMEIEKKIKKFLLYEEYPFTMPQIDAVKVNRDESLFKQALNYEDGRIEHLYKLTENAPCSFTKGLISKLIKDHKQIQHLLSLAYKIEQTSEDALLVQQAIYKLL